MTTPVKFGSEFQVNTFTSSYQSNAAVTGLADGGYVVAWQSYGQDGASYGIYVQRYDASGVAVGGEFQVNTYTNSSQGDPAVTELAGGGFVVTWESFGQDGSSNGIYGQRYDAAGTASGTEFHISTYTDDFQSNPAVTSFDDGSFVVIWKSDEQDGSGYGVYGQRYDASGVAVGVEFQVNTYTAGGQDDVAVTTLTSGGFVVTWNSTEQDASSYGVYAQRYNAAGTAVGGEFRVNTEEMQLQAEPSITALNDGGFVVTWESYLQDGDSYGIYGQRYDGSGATVGSEFQINSHTTSSQNNVSVAALADGGFVVTWHSSGQDSSLYGIFGQRYDAAGDTVGDEFQVNTYTTNDQEDPWVTGLDNGGFVVAWESDGQDGNVDGVYAQQYAAQLFGTSAADTVEDTVGAGWINGQGGGDTLKGLGGKDTIYGGGGADTLSGGASKDFLYGQGGKDTLKGGKGNDELDGGAKDDKLTGGDGKDKFIFMDGSGKDKITDFEDDIDTLKLDEALWGGGMTKQQVINTYASVDGGDIVFDFGSDELRLKGFTDLTELKDDMGIF